MQKIATLSKKFLLSYKSLPSKKEYIEVITAILSVPVLVTVIMINVNNLNASKTKTADPTPQVKQQTVYVPVVSKNADKAQTSSVNTSSPGASVAPTSEVCKPEIGPIAISSPDEGDTITDNPTSILVDYKAGAYCAVVWSYRINGGNWSEYDDKSLALYNLPKGNIKIELKVKSIVSGGEKVLTRNFIYNGNTQTTPTVTPDVQNVKNSSSSAN